MAKKTSKIKPDTTLKNYWRGNGQFADLFNADKKEIDSTWCRIDVAEKWILGALSITRCPCALWDTITEHTRNNTMTMQGNTKEIKENVMFCPKSYTVDRAVIMTDSADKKIQRGYPCKKQTGLLQHKRPVHFAAIICYISLRNICSGRFPSLHL